MITLENFLVFLLGLIVGKVLANLLTFGKSLLMVKTTELECLKMLSTAAQDIAFIKQMKERAVQVAGVDVNEMKAQNNLDEYSVTVWKRAAINNLLAGYPKLLRSGVKYHDWDGAMARLIELLDEQNKK